MIANEEAIKKIVAAGLMLNCRINPRLIWQRKHYSWPDLPSGYQRTMSGSYSVPVGEDGEFLGIRIREIHLEEDPAKWDPVTGCVDYNRCGYPLIEIVTEPDFTTSEQAGEWIKKLLTTLNYINAVDKEAGIKSDVNVSISGHPRVETKNVNSIKSIMKTIEYEIKRQQDELKAGKPLIMHTRAWDDALGVTHFMRSKETAQEYMFIPDPDLPVVMIDNDYLNAIIKTLPEKPHEKLKKFLSLGIDKDDAQILANEIMLAEMFEKIAKKINPVLAARWLRKELLRVANYNELEIDQLNIDEKHIIELLEMVEKKEITDNVAKKILEQLATKPFSPKEYVKKEGLGAVSNTAELEKVCKEAIAENPAAVEEYRKGNEKSFNFLVGAVMRKTRGKAAPNEVNAILKKLAGV